MKYIIISLILISFSFNIALAQTTSTNQLPNWLINLYQQTDKKVKQLIDTMKQKDVEKKAKEALEKTQKTIEEKQGDLLDQVQEKVKKEAKQGISNWFENKKKWLERKMNPLKIKFQEGSNVIREWVDGLKDYFKND